MAECKKKPTESEKRDGIAWAAEKFRKHDGKSRGEAERYAREVYIRHERMQEEKGR